MHNFTHAVMFHHFHDELNHCKGQGSISSRDFSNILKYIKDRYNLLDPEDYEDKVINGCIGSNDVVLTFDDALKSQSDIAYPILEKEGIKAYFFVYTNAFTDNPCHLEFYRDYRNTVFEKIEDFYENFFALFEDLLPSLYSSYENSYPVDHLSHFTFYTEPDRRFRFARDEILGPDNYCLLMNKMITASGYSRSKRSKLLFMNETDLLNLSMSGHSIGLHSSSHPTRIDSNSYSNQFVEYTRNFEYISEVIGKKPTSMSHPCGRYNSDTLKILKDIGIRIGFCSSVANSDPGSCLEIPREDHVNLLNFINR